MSRVKQLIGQRFGRLSVVKYAGLTRFGKAKWFCRCDCGNEKICIGGNLVSGKTTSCGCVVKERLVTHGGHKTPEYRAWQDMKDRCFNPKNECYKYYGGRGISVCAEWVDDFSAFLKVVGYKPKGRYSLDRVDNDGNYEPTNVRWATISEQNSNKRHPSTTGVRGVDLIQNKSRYRLRWHNKQLGVFKTLQETVTFKQERGLYP